LEAALGGADLLLGDDHAARVQREDPDRTFCKPSVGVRGSPDGDVDTPRPADIHEGVDRDPEDVTWIEIAREAPHALRDFLFGDNAPRRGQEEDPDRAGLRSRLIIEVRADCDGPDGPTCSVQVAQARDSGAESVAVGKRSSEVPRGRADLRMGLDRPVRVQEEDPDRASARSSVVVVDRSDRQVGHPVAVEIPEGVEAVSE
jgi:hypothetical protein